MGFAHGVNAVASHNGTEGRHGLKFGPSISGVDLIRFLGLHDPFAAYRAGKAPVMIGFQPLIYRSVVAIVGPFENGLGSSCGLAAHPRHWHW